MNADFQRRRLYIEKESISQLPDESGVYFLYQRGNILVYIGKAKSLKKRIVQHDTEKEFSRIGYELVHYSRARKLEKELITLYHKEHGQLPYYNRQS
jgi:excinuclease UvrABC nuclease subunit